MTTKTTLKPCPFCGSTATWACFDHSRYKGQGDVYAIECENEDCPVGCSMDIDTWKPTLEEAAAQWNTRQ